MSKMISAYECHLEMNQRDMVNIYGKGCSFSYSDLERPLKRWEVMLSWDLMEKMAAQLTFLVEYSREC